MRKLKVPAENETRRELKSLTVNFTAEQVAWLDRRALRSQSFSRAAEVRALVQEAIDREETAAVAA